MELSFEVTFDPPLDSAYARIYGADAFASVGSLVPPVDFVTVTGLTTNETTVSRTQSLTVVIEVTSTHSTNYCSDVQVQAYLNGLSFDVRTFNMGGLSALTTCPDGEQQVYNLIIP